MTSPIVLAALISGLLASFGAVLATAWRFGGRIRSSEASRLWDESRDIRDDYRAQIAAMRKVIDACQARIDELAKRNQELYLENGRLGRVLEEHEETIRDLRKIVSDLSVENKTLKGRVRDLESENAKLRGPSNAND